MTRSVVRESSKRASFESIGLHGRPEPSKNVHEKRGALPKFRIEPMFRGHSAFLTVDKYFPPTIGDPAKRCGERSVRLRFHDAIPAKYRPSFEVVLLAETTGLECLNGTCVK
jgi:hypothetical protein